MRKISRIWLLWTLGFLSMAMAQNKTTIAVLKLEAKNIGQETAEAVADILSTELFNSQRFTVIERQAMTRIMEEQSLQMTGVTDLSQAVEIGKILNVEKIMIGSVSKLGSSIIVNTRLVDVKTGALELAQNAVSQRGEEGLTGAISELVAKISRKITIEGAVIKVIDNTVLVDLGANHGIVEAMDLQVIRFGDVITDLGGSTIGRAEDHIGYIRIVAVKSDYSEAFIRDSKTPLHVGDRVRLTQGPVEIKAKEPDVKKEKKEGDNKAPLEPPPVF